MADELKPGSFRVWDTLGHCYEADVHGICFLDESGALWSMSPGCERMASWDGIDCCNMTRMDMTRYQVERWTGLRDRDGRPVYEGDIVFIPELQAEGYESQAVVRFVNDWWCGIFVDDLTDDNNFANLSHGNFVIIGTIHSDPATLAQAAERAREGR